MATKDATAAPPADQAATEEIDASPSQALKASNTVKNYVFAAMGAGLIPIPLADVTVITGVQLKMLHALASQYDVKFTKDLGKSFIASLTGGVAAAGIGNGALLSLVKSVPVIGTVAGMITMPVVAGASTYAIGQVFVQHFESGGTFLTFDPGEVKSYFAEQFEKGKLVVADFNK